MVLARGIADDSLSLPDFPPTKLPTIWYHFNLASYPLINSAICLILVQSMTTTDVTNNSNRLGCE